MIITFTLKNKKFMQKHHIRQAQIKSGHKNLKNRETARRVV